MRPQNAIAGMRGFSNGQDEKRRSHDVIIIIIINIFERGLNNVNYCKDHGCPDSSDEW